MKSSIHTFELTKRITYEDYNLILSCYPKNRYIINNCYTITTYVNSGIRMVLSRCKYKEEYMFKEYDKQYKITIIVTPYKLLNHGEHIGFLYDPDEFENSINMLESILYDFFNPTGLNLYCINDYTLRRIDAATDITMLSAEQISELLRITKYYYLPSGYRIWSPDEAQINKCKNFSKDLSTYINSDSQGVSVVAYDKEKQMKNLGYKESIISQAENILRLEVALKRKWIRKQFDSDNKSMLYKVFAQSDSIIKYYFIKLFGDGCYVSKDISKIIIESELYNRKKAAEKLLKLQKYIRETQSAEIGFNTAFPGASRKKKCNIYDKLKDIWINPITVKCDYIPSFRCMLGELGEWESERENYIRNFSKKDKNADNE